MMKVVSGYANPIYQSYTSMCCFAQVSRFRRLAQRASGAKQKQTRDLKIRLRDIIEPVLY